MRRSKKRIAAGIVGKHGKPFESRLLPRTMKHGQISKCFDHTFIIALKSNGQYKYVEGFATDPENPDHWFVHAWLTDAGERFAYDTTWRCYDDAGLEFPVPSTYVGIVMDINLVAQFVKQTGYQSVLMNRHRAPELWAQIVPEAAP